MSILARFTFKADRAEEFLMEGQQVTQLDFDEIEELIEYTKSFEDALEDVTVLYRGKTYNASDFPLVEAKNRKY
jgi:hypothetical protein